jgi:DNA-binding beta-propeller fold protein YncE
VHGQNQLAEIDPAKDQLIARYPIAGCSEPHGLLIDSEHRLAFVACEENAKLAVFDLEAKKMTAIHSVGADPDVLAFDKGFARLYVSAESGIIAIFDERGRNLEKVGEGFFAPNAHSVAVDMRTHRVYFPLQNVGGKPVLRIAVPSDKQPMTGGQRRFDKGFEPLEACMLLALTISLFPSSILHGPYDRIL